MLKTIMRTSKTFNRHTIIFYLTLALYLIPCLLFAQLNPTQIVSIPMRDGKFLAADVYIPAACTSCPTILIQTPYNKNSFRAGLPMGFGLNLQSSPYAWVVADWRGFFGSVSAAVAQPKRGEDGYDIISWISTQSWSNGKVGTWGPSALGVIQYQTMKEKHPSHLCAIPIVAHPQTHYQGYFYGGALESSRLQSLDMLGFGLSPLVLANPYYNLVWQITENSTWYPQDISTPTLQIGGWYDHNIDRMMDWYKACRTSADTSVRNHQWLLVGPWVHGGTGPAYVGSSIQGELSYPDAAQKNDTMSRSFFEYYLLNSGNWLNTPKITHYELGTNAWRFSNDSTIEISQSTELFLNDQGTLIAGNGINSSLFISEPRNPSPTIGGHTLSQSLNQGPYSQNSLIGRTDLMTFETSALSQDINVSGRIKVHLFIECDQPDADIVVRLTDAYPDGRDMLINDGIRRMRFRNGYTQALESFMQIGQVYEAVVELPFVNYTWKSGHKIKIYISGNSSTRWDVNLQNGDTMYTAGDTNTAIITIHHNSSNPSRITLPSTNLPLALEDSIETNPFQLYPIPANQTLHINYSKLYTKTLRYKIIDIQGRLIQKSILSDSNIRIDDLISGIYFLQIYDQEGQQIYIRHFIKQ
ncbi:MAG: CocE/NonD family hydrolase [Bacteroidetes bacterium]|nr:MAG: CocE/NonD family hydrolase [Bacteroidota bacterium]REK06464.1 MAG: CocE/NonD family hydrolase [Bacteroidota bacterium]REK33230.1 MAG: CocE/NonD family hydrolase [Bacteroidota bacterium]REK47067.1 MAG: CocE/NonD family hydrolase [Bacteroidota bacterium]